MAQVSGLIKTGNNEPATRTLRFYRRDTGAFLGSAISNPATGEYVFNTDYLDEVQVVVVNSVFNSIDNDQIKRVIPI